MGDPESGQTLISDAELIAAIKSGDMAAYGDLYRRHVAAAQGLARQLMRGPAEVDDVVAETFSKVLDLMRRGGGPQDAFRPYLLTSVRRVAYDRYRGERRNVVTDEIEAFDPGQPFIDPAVAGLERSLIARAFLSLPERWRAVLWHTEIEGAKPADVAPLLGLTANGVAALAYRAREGLRQAYLQMHLSGVARQECRPIVDKLGAFVRGGLSAREAKAVSDHLDGCEDCRGVYAELADVNVALRGLVAPIFLGPVAAAYLAAMSAKGGAAVAWIVTKVLWIRHAPKQQQAAMAGGVAAAAAAIAVALALAGHGMPAAARHHRAAAPASPGSTPVAAPAPGRHVPPVPAANVPLQAHVSPAKPGKPGKPGKTPPPSSTPPPSPVTLSTQVAPVGALLRGTTGMLTFTVTNTGSQSVSDLSASIRLPSGVSYLGGGSLGMDAPLAAAAPGGWNCGATAAGAGCTHGPLGPGQTTKSYLEVAVGQDAAFGVPPTISVNFGGRSVTATAASGVVSSGLPARFAANGRLDTIVAGNTLPQCWWWDFGWHPPSSSAEVAVTGNVLWAGLYWSGSGYQSHPEIDLRGPRGGSYQAIGANDAGSAYLDGYPVYQAYANVTSMVQDNGGGAWQAQVPTDEYDPAADSGWTLVVVAEDPAAPVGQAVVVDGAHAVSAADPWFNVPLNGLLPAGADAGIQVVTWDGFGSSSDPTLTSRHETLAAEPAVELSASGEPYLVGVVAATTSADSTQSGPPPNGGSADLWWDRGRVGAAGDAARQDGAAGDTAQQVGVAGDAGKQVGVAGDAGWPVGVAGYHGWPLAGCSWFGGRSPAGPTAVKSVSGNSNDSAPADGSNGTSGAGSPTGHQAGSSGSGGSKPGQDPPLPHRVKPDPCPLCKLAHWLGFGGSVAVQPAPGVPDGVGQRPVSQPGHPGALTGGLPDARQLGDVRGPHRKLGVGLNARGKQHVVGRPDELGDHPGVCADRVDAGVQKLAERTSARPGNIDDPGDPAPDAVHHPGREVAGIGQPDRSAGIAGGQHAAAACQPGQPPRQPAHVVVRARDNARTH